MNNKNFGFLRLVSDKKQADAPKYPLKQGTHSFGCSLNADIRLLLKNFTESILCVLNVDEEGHATLVNQSFRVPILVNLKQVKHSQTLKHNDKIQIATKHFIYLNENTNEKGIEKIAKSAQIKKKRCQSASSLLTSRIPVKTTKLQKTPVSKALRVPNTTSKAIQPVTLTPLKNVIKRRLSLGNDREQKPISTRNVRLSTEDKQEWEQQVKTPQNNKSFTKETNSARRASRSSIRTPKPPLMPSISEVTENKPNRKQSDTQTVSNSGCSTSFIVEDLMVFSLKENAKISDKMPEQQKTLNIDNGADVGGIDDESMINFYTPENNTSIVTINTPLESGKVARKSKTLNRTISSEVSTPKSIISNTMSKKRGRESSETVEKAAKKLKASTSISFINRNFSFEEECTTSNIESPVICSKLKSNKCMTETKPKKRSSLRRKSIAAIKLHVPTNDELEEIMAKISDKNVTKRRRKSAYVLRETETEFESQTKRSRSLGARRNTEVKSMESFDHPNDLQLKNSSMESLKFANESLSSGKSNRFSMNGRKSEIGDGFESQGEDEVFNSVSVIEDLNESETYNSNNDSLGSQLKGMKENAAVMYLSKSMMIETANKNSSKTRSKSLGVVKLNPVDGLESQSEVELNLSNRSRRSFKSASVIEDLNKSETYNSNNDSLGSQLEGMKENAVTMHLSKSMIEAANKNSRKTRSKSLGVVKLNPVDGLESQSADELNLSNRSRRSFKSVSVIEDLNKSETYNSNNESLRSQLEGMKENAALTETANNNSRKTRSESLCDFNRIQFYNEKLNSVKDHKKPRKPQKSPKNDLTQSRTLRGLFSPNIVVSPINDLTNVRNLRRLFSSQVMKSPANDLTDVRGVKKLMSTPKAVKSPKNDLTDVKGLKKLFRDIQSPKNDLTNVKGVKDMFKQFHSPVNSLLDVSGIQRLFVEKKNVQFDVNESLSNSVEETDEKATQRKRTTKKEETDEYKEVEEKPKRNTRGRKKIEETKEDVVEVVMPSKKTRGAKKNADEEEGSNGDVLVEPKRTRSGKKYENLEDESLNKIEQLKEPKRPRRGKTNANPNDESSENNIQVVEPKKTRRGKKDVVVDDESLNKIEVVDKPKRGRRAKKTVDVKKLPMEPPTEIAEKPKRGRRAKKTENVEETSNEEKQMESRSTRKRKPEIENKKVEETVAEPLRRSKRTCTKR